LDELRERNGDVERKRMDIVNDTVLWKLAAWEEEKCKNRRIHIRRLPPRFNMNLLANYLDYPLLDDLCPYLKNNDLGQKTHNLLHSWY